MGHKHSLERLITKAVSYNGRGLYFFLNNDIDGLSEINVDMHQKFIASLAHLPNLSGDGPGCQFILDNQGDYTLEYQFFDDYGFLDDRFSATFLLSKAEAEQLIFLLLKNKIPIFDVMLKRLDK
jgi:hypothetical protein